MQNTLYNHFPTSDSQTYILSRSVTALGALVIIYTLDAGLRKYLQRRGRIVLNRECLPPPQLPNQWPLGIDWIRKLWRSDSEQHLLAFLCSIADGYEPRNNLCQYLLFGPRAFHVLDPKNLESVLSTEFQDMSLRCTRFSLSWLPRRKLAELRPLSQHHIHNLQTRCQMWELEEQEG